MSTTMKEGQKKKKEKKKKMMKKKTGETKICLLRSTRIGSKDSPQPCGPGCVVLCVKSIGSGMMSTRRSAGEDIVYSYHRRTEIWEQGGRGWWSKDDESHIVWEPKS